MIMSTKEICKRGLSMTISLTLGNTLFPFGDGLPHHMEPGGQLLLGEALGLPEILQVFREHCAASFLRPFYQGNRRCGKQRRRTWPLSRGGVTSPVPRRTAPAWR